MGTHERTYLARIVVQTPDPTVRSPRRYTKYVIQFLMVAPTFLPKIYPVFNFGILSVNMLPIFDWKNGMCQLNVTSKSVHCSTSLQVTQDVIWHSTGWSVGYVTIWCLLRTLRSARLVWTAITDNSFHSPKRPDRIHGQSFSLSLSLWRNSPKWAKAASSLRFLDHAQWHITVGRTRLDEWSAHRKDFCLTTQNNHNRQTYVYTARWIRTRNPRKRSASEPRLRPLGHCVRCPWTTTLLVTETSPRCWSWERVTLCLKNSSVLFQGTALN